MKEENKVNDKLKGYSGLFFDEESIKKLVEAQKNGLSDIVNHIHTTFKFGELEQFPDELIGNDFEIKVVGYASDGRNSGYRVELPEELKQYYANESQPHITVSIGEVDGQKGKPVDTGKLDFKDLEEPFSINGKLGYFIFGKDVVMDNSEFSKTYTAEELSNKYLEYIKIGEEYSSDEFDKILNVAKVLISIKNKIALGNVECREFKDLLTENSKFNSNFIRNLRKILYENGLSCYDFGYAEPDEYFDPFSDDNPYTDTITSLLIDGYSFDFYESNGSLSHLDVQKAELDSSVPEFEFDKVIKILDTKIDEFMKNHNSNSIETEPNTDDKNIADLTIEELQGIINENDSIIKSNDESIKQALIARILEQQRTIEGQQTEIGRLKSQMELQNEK